MHIYTHEVRYYETDRMGITHHSNYIRWMEEARLSYLNAIGFGLDRLEKLGIVSPVTSVECKYKATTTFPEKVDIAVRIEEFRGVLLKLSYTMRNAAGTVVAQGKSEHAFTTETGRLVRLDRTVPELDALLKRVAAEEKKEGYIV